MALTGKQAAFVEEYLIDFNATQAALRSGYSEKTAYSIGARLLKNVEVAEAISQRIGETAMTADEVLSRLADHARGSLADFVTVTDDGPTFDFAKAERLGKMHLIKKLRTKKRMYKEGKGDDAIPVTVIETDLELYDAQAALQLIGKHHSLFTDRVDHVVRNIDLSKLSIEQLDRISNGEDPVQVILSGYIAGNSGEG